MFLDGGLRLLRLEPRSGRLLSETILDDKIAGSEKDLQSYVSWLNMPVALPDILSSDGRQVYMRSQPFGLDGRRRKLEPIPSRQDANAGTPPPVHHPENAHLFSPTGFLDDTWWHRTYWLHGSNFYSGWCGYYTAGKTAPAGRILTFDESTVYGFGRKPQYYRWTTPIEHHLFAAVKLSEKSNQPADNTKRPKGYKVNHRWTRELPLMVRAMVLAGKTLFVAGPADLVDEERAFQQIGDPKARQEVAEQAVAMAGKRGGLLWAVSTAGGEKLAEHPLDTLPVFDGMAAADGRLYVSAVDGMVLCFRPQ